MAGKDEIAKESTTEGKPEAAGLPAALLSDAEKEDAALSDELGSPVNPEQAKQAEENKKLMLQMAEGGALETVNTFATLLKKRYPHITIDGEERQRVAAAAAPVMLKHSGGEMPAWLLPYAEEFRLGMALAGVGFGVWLQMQAHEEALELQRQQAEQDRKNGITRGQQAAMADGHPGKVPAAAPTESRQVDLSTSGPMAGLPGGVTL